MVFDMESLQHPLHHRNDVLFVPDDIEHFEDGGNMRKAGSSVDVVGTAVEPDDYIYCRHHLHNVYVLS